MAIVVMSSVPVSSGMKPKDGGVPVGAHSTPVKNSKAGISLKKRPVSNSTDMRMPMVVRTAIPEHTTRKPSVIFSNRLRARKSGVILENSAKAAAAAAASPAQGATAGSGAASRMKTKSPASRAEVPASRP